MKKLARPVLSTRSGSLPSVGLVDNNQYRERGSAQLSYVAVVVVAYDTVDVLRSRNIPVGIAAF